MGIYINPDLDLLSFLGRFSKRIRIGEGEKGTIDENQAWKEDRSRPKFIPLEFYCFSLELIFELFALLFLLIFMFQ